MTTYDKIVGVFATAIIEPDYSAAVVTHTVQEMNELVRGLRRQGQVFRDIKDKLDGLPERERQMYLGTITAINNHSYCYVMLGLGCSCVMVVPERKLDLAARELMDEFDKIIVTDGCTVSIDRARSALSAENRTVEVSDWISSIPVIS